MRLHGMPRCLKSMASRLLFRCRMKNGLQRFIPRICRQSKPHCGKQSAKRARDSRNSASSRADGAIRNVLAVGRAILDEHGEYQPRPRHRPGRHRRKQAEKRLQESESKHRVLFEDSSDAHLLSDENGFVDCNSALLQMFGYTNLAELKGLRPADLSPPNQPDGTPSQAGVDREMATTFLKGANSFEWLHRRKNGEVFPAEVCLTALTLNGRPGLLGTVRDITERKLAEASLRNSEEQFRQLADNISEVFFVVEPEPLRMAYLSPAYEEIWGTPARKSMTARGLDGIYSS